MALGFEQAFPLNPETFIGEDAGAADDRDETPTLEETTGRKDTHQEDDSSEEFESLYG